MKKTLLAVMMAVTLLVGCNTAPKVVPVEVKFDPAKVLAKPPAEAMKDPIEPTPLRYGAPNAENSAIMKENNLNAANERSKVRILQQYIRNIFNPQK